MNDLPPFPKDLNVMISEGSIICSLLFLLLTPWVFSFSFVALNTLYPLLLSDHKSVAWTSHLNSKHFTYDCCLYGSTNNINNLYSCSSPTPKHVPRTDFPILVSGNAILPDDQIEKPWYRSLFCLSLTTQPYHKIHLNLSLKYMELTTCYK